MDPVRKTPSRSLAQGGQRTSVSDIPPEVARHLHRVPTLHELETQHRRNQRLVCLGVLAVLLTSMLLAGCTTTRPPASSWCDVNIPFRPTEESLAAMSDPEIADALSHNLFGQQACNWKP